MGMGQMDRMMMGLPPDPLAWMDDPEVVAWAKAMRDRQIDYLKGQDAYKNKMEYLNNLRAGGFLPDPDQWLRHIQESFGVGEGGEKLAHPGTKTMKEDLKDLGFDSTDEWNNWLAKSTGAAQQLFDWAYGDELAYAQRGGVDGMPGPMRNTAKGSRGFSPMYGAVGLDAHRRYSEAKEGFSKQTLPIYANAFDVAHKANRKWYELYGEAVSRALAAAIAGQYGVAQQMVAYGYQPGYKGDAWGGSQAGKNAISGFDTVNGVDAQKIQENEERQKMIAAGIDPDTRRPFPKESA